jgi:formate-dependent nitrite reductase membrane component NrfD
MQIKPYEFMVKYTPHTRWAEGSGALIAVAFFLGGISGGLYLMSLYFDSLLGMFIGWLLALLVGMVDMVHLHKPLRFWRMLLKPNTSWIARGFIFIAFFIGFGALQLAVSYWLPGRVLENVLKVFSGLGAFGVVIYSGFVMSYVKAIRLWNSAVIPLLFVISSLVGGADILLLINLGKNIVQVDTLEAVLQIMLVSYAVMIGLHIWISTYSSPAARNSAMWILKGNIASIFWTVTVLVGIIIPLFIFFFFSSEVTALLITGAIFVIIGNFTLRYILLKGGLYSPLVPSYDIV